MKYSGKITEIRIPCTFWNPKVSNKLKENKENLQKIKDLICDLMLIKPSAIKVTAYRHEWEAKEKTK